MPYLQICLAWLNYNERPETRAIALAYISALNITVLKGWGDDACPQGREKQKYARYSMYGPPCWASRALVLVEASAKAGAEATPVSAEAWRAATVTAIAVKAAIDYESGTDTDAKAKAKSIPTVKVISATIKSARHSYHPHYYLCRAREIC